MSAPPLRDESNSTDCEVCGRLLDRRNTMGICARCWSDGATFRRKWTADLRAAGYRFREIEGIVGSREHSRRYMAEAAQR